MQRRLNLFTIALVTCIAFSPVRAFAQSCPNGQCPPVYARATQGGTIICRGEACAMIIGQLQQQAIQLQLQEYQFVDEDPPIDKDSLCREMQQSKPLFCDSNPDVPGINISHFSFVNTVANGCDEDWTGFIDGEMASAGIASVYSGYPDRPWSHSTLDFHDACSQHTACYAAQSGQAECDRNLTSSLTDACGSQFVTGSSSMSVCSGIVSAYSNSMDRGGPVSYAHRESLMKCALWRQDMEANECPQ